jgi:chemotaxis protein histidine kinase CheA
MEQVFAIISEDEDFRFGKIKVEKDKQRYTLPAPTKDDPEDTESVKAFYGVVVYFRKAFFNNPEKNEKVEKRELAILRAGKFMPELLYISKAGLWNWKGFLAAVEKQKLDSYSHVMVRFTAEPGQSSDGVYKFSKVKMEIVSELEAEEIEYLQELQQVVRTRVRKYSSSEDLDSAEDKYLDEEDKKPSGNAPAEDDDDAIAAKAAKRTRAIAEEDDDEPAPKTRAKAKPAPVDDDDDETPAPKTRAKAKPAPVEDEDDEPAPKTRAKAKPAPVEDDDDEPAPKTRAKAKPAPVEDEDDDEDLKPKTRAKAKPEPEPVAKTKGKYPNIDDEDDED